MAKHLAIFTHNLASAVLSGKKTVDFRFSQSKISPYLKVQKGDTVFVKNVGDKVIGQAEVDNVLYYDSLTNWDLDRLRAEYSGQALISEEFFKKLSEKGRYLSLIFFKKPERFVAELNITKKNRRGWLVINEN